MNLVGVQYFRMELIWRNMIIMKLFAEKYEKKLNLEGKYVVGHAGRFSDQKKSQLFCWTSFKQYTEKSKYCVTFIWRW